MSISDEIFALFNARGHTAYLGEDVSQTEHALQAAHLAAQEGASDDLVVAALLHDIGHLTNGLPEDIAERGIDGHHEHAGAKWLKKNFKPEVTEPIRLHVAAKRYLCATEPSYHAGLSAASQRSLKIQGGPMGARELGQFESSPHARGAIRLRRWDDEAKVPGLAVPDLGHYRARIEAIARKPSEP
jgi:gamma-butyrobetaine dioxygenase